MRANLGGSEADSPGTQRLQKNFGLRYHAGVVVSMRRAALNPPVMSNSIVGAEIEGATSSYSFLEKVSTQQVSGTQKKNVGKRRILRSVAGILFVVQPIATKINRIVIHLRGVCFLLKRLVLMPHAYRDVSLLQVSWQHPRGVLEGILFPLPPPNSFTGLCRSVGVLSVC